MSNEKPRRYLSMPDRVPNGEPMNDAIAAMQAAQRAERAVVSPLRMPRKRVVHRVVRPAYLNHEPVSHPTRLVQSSGNARRRVAARNGWDTRKASS